MATGVTREVVPGQIWTISKPFARFSGKVGGRATIIKLNSGDLFVVSPTKLDDGTLEWVNTLGTVKYLMAPDMEHHLFLKPWKEAFPEAQVLAPQGMNLKEQIKFDYLYTPDHLDQTYGDGEILAHYFPGHKTLEIALLHVPSRTLINADLTHILPAREQYSMTKEDPTKGFVTGLFIKGFSPGNNWLHNFIVTKAQTKDAKYVLFYVTDECYETGCQSRE